VFPDHSLCVHLSVFVCVCVCAGAQCADDPSAALAPRPKSAGGRPRCPGGRASSGRAEKVCVCDFCLCAKCLCFLFICKDGEEENPGQMHTHTHTHFRAHAFALTHTTHTHTRTHTRTEHGQGTSLMKRANSRAARGEMYPPLDPLALLLPRPPSLQEHTRSSSSSSRYLKR